MPTIRRIRVVLNLSKTNAPALLAKSRAVYHGLDSDKTTFSAPNPTLPVFLVHIDDLDSAEQATATKTKGTVAIRNTKRDFVVTDMESQRMYVQSLCDANPERAVAIATAAGMAIGKPPAHSKPVLAVKPGSKPGAVLLVANATLLVGRGVHKRAAFNWQFSADGGKTWVGAPSTPLASTEIDNLTPMTTYAFRVCVTVAKVTGEWSQAVTALVR
jgi:hypothetical protein